MAALGKHLLGITGATREQVVRVLDTAETFAEVSERTVAKVPALRGRTVAAMFFEPSTRTRVSFELAAKRLSADFISFSADSSSHVKGESLRDTCQTLAAMNVDIAIVRHAASGAAQFVAREAGFSVVNAGDGMHEHPTQALLDAFTIRRALGRLEGLTIVLCGDVLHSRVARSHLLLWPLLGSRVRVFAPRALAPRHFAEAFGISVYADPAQAFDGADVIIALRLQHERMQGTFLPSAEEYAHFFCLREELLRCAKPDVLVMHPGPVNRGIDIAEALLEDARCKVLDQVQAGVAVRMAVLYLLAAYDAAPEKTGS